MVADDRERMARNVRENREKWAAHPYFEEAEQEMATVWAQLYPAIKDYDFTNVLELAPGHGRNTEKLREISNHLHLVDVSAECIEFCKKRFAQSTGPCQLDYYINDGSSLPMIPDGSISFVYSVDAMVHFDKAAVRGYVQEFARIMQPGAAGIAHYSNYGNQCPDRERNWLENPHWRSTMTRELFAEYCTTAGLEIIESRVIDWGGYQDLDAVSFFTKP